MKDDLELAGSSKRRPGLRPAQISPASRWSETGRRTARPLASLGPSALPAQAWDWAGITATLRPRLLSIGRRRFGLPIQDLEDTFQTVVTEILTRQPTHPVPRAYVTKAFYFACCDKLQQKRANAPLLDPGADRVHELDAACDVATGLSRIGPRCREIICRWALEGRTMNETADATGLSRATVWKRVNRCLRRLRACLT